MKVGVLFSGGKDSTYALLKAMEREDVKCLISITSRNPESYMFHTPNINITQLQSKAVGIPLVEAETEGVKEKELEDLSRAIILARKRYGIEGIVTGAIESVYQAERVQRICDKAGLWCFNPLWKKNQVELLHELVENKFKVIISGVFAYPFNEKWLGREIDIKTIGELIKLNSIYQINPSGEGGEIETTVLDTPFFKKRIEIQESQMNFRGNSGVYTITKARLVDK